MAIMTQRHYRAIAEILSQVELQDDDRTALIEQFCNWFEADNHKFDKMIFLKYIDKLRA